ncbi:hypothetical protein FACS1894200_05250 [Spirochaetia bacterium]|nr:hypothetical protein FACS1894200_05250 [Spirochaetia bacterium]
MRKFLFIMLLPLVVLSCASEPPDLHDGLTPEQLVQKAQECSDNYDYKWALQYYAAIIEQYPANREFVCTAEYEIAFIHYKQEKYAEAKEEFNALLSRYDEGNIERELLPAQYVVLCKKMLEKIADKLIVF